MSFHHKQPRSDKNHYHLGLILITQYFGQGLINLSIISDKQDALDHHNATHTISEMHIFFHERVDLLGEPDCQKFSFIMASLQTFNGILGWKNNTSLKTNSNFSFNADHYILNSRQPVIQLVLETLLN